jgi:hypothetical protein
MIPKILQEEQKQIIEDVNNMLLAAWKMTKVKPKKIYFDYDEEEDATYYLYKGGQGKEFLGE